MSKPPKVNAGIPPHPFASCLAPVEIPARSFRGDFWLTGGISLVALAVMLGAQIWRHDYAFVEMRFAQVGAGFALLALVCNHPHFMASYRIAYGRGIRYCFRHWFALMALPLALMGAYAYAYQNFDAQIGDHPATAFLNKGLALSGLGFRLGEAANLGTEILGLSVWLMYLTVGWHYAKQVFGVMLVAGRRGKYPISQWQRWLIKLSLFAVGFYSLCIITLHRQEFYPAASRMYFLSLPITNLGLPAVLDQLSGWIVALGAVGVLGGVFGTNYWRRQKLPPRNLLVPWLAFFAWWIPLSPQPEYYFMMVPFFHSLQYLPFAIAAEKARTGAEVTEAKFARRLLVLLAAGFLAFEAIPGLLESTATSMPEPLFFTIAAAVFINVHHFFIDSVIWRGEHPETRRALA